MRLPLTNRYLFKHNGTGAGNFMMVFDNHVLGVQPVGRMPKDYLIVKVTFQLNDGAGAV
jgi:hypothetical protein